MLKDCSSLTTPSKIFFCCKISDRGTLKEGLFKAEKREGADKKAPAVKIETAESPEKQKQADLSRWEKFVNGSLKHF